MWDSFDAAATALTRDGWIQETAYWFHKPTGNAGGHALMLELELRDCLLWPVQRDDEYLNKESM